MEKHEVLPMKGTLHDLGLTTTHKAKIVAKSLEGKQPPDIARETCHSIDAVKNYIQDYNRVKMAIDKGIKEEEISMIVKLSPRLVEEYLVLMETIQLDIFLISLSLFSRCPEIIKLGAMNKT